MPNIKHGKFTLEEDLKLTVGVQMFGNNWADINNHVFTALSSGGRDTRSDMQCRERWTTALNPSSKLTCDLTKE